MSELFLHGVEVVEITSGARPIRTVRSSTIGLIGTAPDADPAKFPLNTPVLIAGKRTDAAGLGTTGTLPGAVDAIFDQAGAVIALIRIAAGSGDAAEAETLANVIGGVNEATGAYEGVQAFAAAESVLGFAPKILIAPGFTAKRASGAVTAVTMTAHGSGYTSAPAVTISGGGGEGAEAVAVVTGGKVTSITITKNGDGYTSAPTVILTGGGGTGAAATAVTGPYRNPVVAEMLGIAERLRAVVIADGPGTTDADAIAYRGDWGSDRVYVIDPPALVMDAGSGAMVPAPMSPRVAGLIARTDQDRGFWWSPSNQEIYGIVGTSRPVDFSLGDYNSRANLLNEKEVATVIRQDGFRLWGNRTTSSDPKFAFLCVRRTADMINESLLKAHLWAVDRCITKTYIEDVIESVRGYLNRLKAQGAILGGDIWADSELNTPTSIQDGRIYFDFDFTPPYPAERVVFRSHLVNTYISDIFAK